MSASNDHLCIIRIQGKGIGGHILRHLHCTHLAVALGCANLQKKQQYLACSSMRCGNYVKPRQWIVKEHATKSAKQQDNENKTVKWLHEIQPRMVLIPELLEARLELPFQNS